MLIRTCNSGCRCICHTYDTADIIMGGGMPSCCHAEDPLAATKALLKAKTEERKRIRKNLKRSYAEAAFEHSVHMFLKPRNLG